MSTGTTRSATLRCSTRTPGRRSTPPTGPLSTPSRPASGSSAHTRGSDDEHADEVLRTRIQAGGPHLRDRAADRPRRPGGAALPSRPRPYRRRPRRAHLRRRRAGRAETWSRRPTIRGSGSTATRWTGRRAWTAYAACSASATVVVPGHGRLVGATFVADQHREITQVAEQIRTPGCAGVCRRRPPCRRGSGRYPAGDLEHAVSAGLRRVGGDDRLDGPSGPGVEPDLR